MALGWSRVIKFRWSLIPWKCPGLRSLFLGDKKFRTKQHRSMNSTHFSDWWCVFQFVGRVQFQENKSPFHIATVCPLIISTLNGNTPSSPVWVTVYPPCVSGAMRWLTLCMPPLLVIKEHALPNKVRESEWLWLDSRTGRIQSEFLSHLSFDSFPSLSVTWPVSIYRICF